MGKTATLKWSEFVSALLFALFLVYADAEGYVTKYAVVFFTILIVSGPDNFSRQLEEAQSCLHHWSICQPTNYQSNTAVLDPRQHLLWHYAAKRPSHSFVVQDGLEAKDRGRRVGIFVPPFREQGSGQKTMLLP